jgi:hypothetical protein
MTASANTLTAPAAYGSLGTGALAVLAVSSSHREAQGERFRVILALRTSLSPPVVCAAFPA